MVCGDGERELAADDWSFTAPSRVTYYMQHVVFTVVIADATMLERAIDADVCSVSEGEGPLGVGAGVAPAAGRRGARGGGG